MGKTVLEKILSRAVGRDVSPGEYTEVSSRLPSSMMHRRPRGVFAEADDSLAMRVADPKLIRVVDGHPGISTAFDAAESRTQGRAWAKQMGVPIENIYELGRSGVEHVTASENAWALPGEIFFSTGLNGHTSTLGALGAFAVTMSYGSIGYRVTGKTWIKVPQSVKVVVRGKLPKGVMGRDVSEYVLGQVGPSAAVGKVMEWTGPVIDEMSMEGRFSICCQAIFFGAWTAIINPDPKTLEYVKSRNSQSFDPLYSDPDATYAKVYEFDVSNISPQVVPPPDRYKVSPVNKLAGTPVTRAFVGSCANSRMEDMRVVAQILKGRKIHPDVIFNITPGTPGILKQCVQEGLMETFIDAETVVAYPCCGMCAGLNTPLAASDVCIASSTCNYPGRMGSEEAQIYLASPATVAASAIEGKITDPRKYL